MDFASEAAYLAEANNFPIDLSETMPAQGSFKVDSVSTYLADANDLPFDFPTGLPKAQMDVIWQMGLTSLAANNQELVIPDFMANKMDTENINDLKSRLSDHLDGTPIAGYFDRPAKVLRILRASEVPALEGGQAEMSSEESRCATPISSPKKPAKKLLQPPKKLKVTRPPNAFILYRSHYHPILLEQRPDLQNNEISVLLGKQWRNEAGEVRAEWKVKADKIKEQHALENPGYQYTPRRPSEKKRRMTVRKLAKLRAAQTPGESPSSSSDVEMADTTLVGDADPQRVAALNRPHEVTEFFPNSQISVSSIMENERTTAYPSRLKKDYKTDDFTIVFPTGHTHIEQDYEIRSAPYEPRDPSEVMDFSSTYSEIREAVPYSTYAADDFMNDIIDWSVIEQDAKFVHACVNHNNLEVLNFDNEEERAEFQEQMNKVLAAYN